MADQERRGLISRFFSRPADSAREASGTGTPDPPQDEVWADNATRPVGGLVAAALREPRCLIVTGYQDFLSSLTILLDVVGDLNERPPGSVRIIFGTNTETRRDLGGAGRPVAEEARRHFLGARGLSVVDLAELRAVLAMDAIERGIIELRAYDPALAEAGLGRRPHMLHAKLFIGERSVLSGSANFSIGGVRRNLEFIDDAGSWPELAAARREAAERFWETGRDWTEPALEILRSLLRLVTPEEAVARTVHEATGFAPWRAAGETSAGRPPQPFQADLVYEAAGTVHEHGFAFIEAPTGAGKTDIGKHLATVLPVAHGQTVFSWGERADQQRLGSIALIPASVLKNWTTNAPANFRPIKHSHLSRRGKEEDAELEEINRSVRSSAAMIVDESHRLSSTRSFSPNASACSKSTRRLLAGRPGRGPEVFIVAPGARIKTGKKLRHLRSGAEAQEYFGIDGRHVAPMEPRAMFMTFQMAEGINLQVAPVLGIVGVTSDVKSLIQGLGRIDRIDSRHSRIHYYTFDLPGLVLWSDRTARARVANIALLSGVGADDLPSEIVEFAAGDLTDLVLDQIRQPRILRRGNYFDLIEGLRRSVPPDVLDRVRNAEPRGLWGADLCLLASVEPALILLLGGRTGGPADPTVLPPRLLAVREVDGRAEVIGDQAEAARLLNAAFTETKRRGLQDHRPGVAEMSATLGLLAATLSHLTHWDVRPARTVSLLASLAGFLTKGSSQDDGQGLFGKFTLPALEKLAEAWAHELDVFWIEAKEAVSQRSAGGGEIPDYIGMDAIYGAFSRQPAEVRASVRSRMESLSERCRALSDGQPIDILSRVAVMFEAKL